MTDDRQERIRQRAHAIWEKAGRPQGAHQQHWDQATAEIDGEDAKPKPKAAKSATARTKAGPKPAAAAKASKPKAAPRKASAPS